MRMNRWVIGTVYVHRSTGRPLRNFRLRRFFEALFERKVLIPLKASDIHL